MRDPARLKSAGAHWLRGGARQCGDRAHRLVAPSMAPTGERRPSMACLRPIPALPRLSPPGCPRLRRYGPKRVGGNGWAPAMGEALCPPKRGTSRREGRRCKGVSSERHMDVPRPRVGAGRGTTRRTRTPCSGGPHPKRSFCPCSGGPAPKPVGSGAFRLERIQSGRERSLFFVDAGAAWLSRQGGAHIRPGTDKRGARPLSSPLFPHSDRA